MDRFKNYLKHKRKETSVEELVVRLRIEAENRKALKGGYNAESSKANVVEEGQSSKNKGKIVELARERDLWTRMQPQNLELAHLAFANFSF